MELYRAGPLRTLLGLGVVAAGVWVMTSAIALYVAWSSLPPCTGDPAFCFHFSRPSFSTLALATLLGSLLDLGAAILLLIGLVRGAGKGHELLLVAILVVLGFWLFASAAWLFGNEATRAVNMAQPSAIFLLVLVSALTAPLLHLWIGMYLTWSRRAGQ